MAPFDRSHTTSFSPSSTVSEIYDAEEYRDLEI